ncbi:hypothetical protein U8326_09875 [Tsuneonella sp. CC-YZS046]|uniref:hypothetical protein n=1 Tax=Tsuneonella sp. CC-YZS046 TaxID=3042152 RepID=UPI002D77288D|nr:hypothetical protein [Tsuneonella sp. CC-YZS046]WRO65370.1 hypothetical protein U8326_09875 [Tsuneonella sp. CC-YZS046]
MSQRSDTMRQQAFLTALSLALVLGACSQGAKEPEGETSGDAVEQGGTVPSGATQAEPTQAQATPASARVLGLEGLGELRIGQPVPKGGSWAERGAQTGDECRTVSSPDYPGVYAIVEGGKVQRITVGQRSDVKLVEGTGVGSTEQDVKKWFAGFREEPHKYEDKPAKYLTAPNAASGDPALRFEIGKDGKVSLIHVGAMPVLAYVEGCA